MYGHLVPSVEYNIGLTWTDVIDGGQMCPAPVTGREEKSFLDNTAVPLF